MKRRTKKGQKQNGFSIFELIVIITVVGIMAASAVAVSGKALSRNELRSTTYGIIDNLRRAEGEAMIGRQDVNWGVHFSSSQYVFFHGASYNPADPDNEVNNLAATIALQSITFTGGGSDMIFTKITGDTATSGSLVVQDNNSGESRTVTVNAKGMVDFN